jgi:hypothetical protein
MIKNNTLAEVGSRRFADAEHLWFWFVSSRRIRSGFRHGGENETRPCELLDVETLITRMYLSGKISAAELECLKKYGDMRRGPNQYMWDENKDAALWLSGMRAIGIAARDRGWIE